MSITTALKARRDALGDREAGFTLIELLVVVLIIGILAAIAIPVYLGVQNNAKDAAVKSDLQNNKTSLIAYQTGNTTQSLPASSTSAATMKTALGNYGWSVSNGATFTSYTLNGTGSTGTFCLIEKSASGTSYFVSSNQPITSGSSCGATSTW